MTLCLRTVKPAGARKGEMLLQFQRRFSRAQGQVLPEFWTSLMIASALPLRMASGLMMAKVRSICVQVLHNPNRVKRQGSVGL